MSPEEIKEKINENIYENQDGDITGEVLNEILNDIVDAVEDSAQSVTVGETTTGDPGTDASVTNSGTSRAPILNFTIPRGADGQDGADAVNPFKGWWPDLATLKAAITATPGDSAYVKDAAPATTWSIYVYSSAATSDKYWADSGTNADTSNVQTFASGEEVNETYLDDSHLANPASGALPIAEDAMNIASKLKALTLEEQKQVFVGANGYYKASTNAIQQYSTSRYTEIPIAGDFNRIRFRGMSFKSSNASYIGYAFKSQNNYILSKAYLDNVAEQTRSVEPKEYIIDIPEGATSFIVTIQFAGSQTVTEESFYCYFQKGVSSIDYSQKLFKAKYERLIQGYINSSTGNIVTNELDNYVALYPVLGGQKLLLLCLNRNNAPYYAFYSSIDSNGKYKAIDNNHYYFEGINTINVPQNANYIGVLYRFSGVGSLDNFSIYSELREYEFVDKNIVFAPIETYMRYSFLKSDGSFYSGNGFSDYKSSYTDIIPCSEGDVFGYFGYGSGSEKSLEPIIVPSSSNSGVSWIFYDSENNIVSAWRMSRYGYYNVVIPNGVVGVRFSSIYKSATTYRPAYFFKKSILNSVLKSIDVIERNPELKNWNGLKWITFGDSLTEHNYRATKNYHDYIAEWTGIEIVNRGLSGSGYKELDSSNKAFYQRVQSQVESDADVITFFGSGNDLHRNSQGTALKYPIGEVTDTNTTTICGCINQTFDYMQANYPLMPLGVITPTPWKSYNQIPSNVSDENTMKEYCDKLIEICRRRGIPVLDLYHCSNLHPESSSFCGFAYKRDATYTITSQGTQGAIEVTEDLLPIVQEFGAPGAVVGDWVLPNYSGVHPDEDGHKFIAPRIKLFIKSLIEK